MLNAVRRRRPLILIHETAAGFVGNKTHFKCLSLYKNGPSFVAIFDIFKSNALWMTMMVSYAQGLQLLGKKSDKKKWDVNIVNAVRVWRDGCIIRSRIVDELSNVSTKNLSYKMLLSERDIKDRVMGMMPSLRRVVGTSHICGVAVPGMGASLDYLEQLLMSKGPWSLIQAQRDCFGSHGFERIDKKGTQHVQWLD